MSKNSQFQEFNVVCRHCGNIFTPAVRSALWWKAKKRADQGYLDALSVSGEECGCIKKHKHANAPFQIFGYDMDCQDFRYGCSTFGQAVSTFRKLNDGLSMVFINGVSPSVERRLMMS